MNETVLVLSLLNIKGWGPNKVHAFIAKCNFDYNLALEKINELKNEEQSQFYANITTSERIIKDNYDCNVGIITLLDSRFPAKLYDSTEKCVLLYYKGNINLLNRPSITIIGTRYPSDFFINKGKDIVNKVATKHYVVVSGLAIGCDYIAHKSCLEAQGYTIAVLPSPCDNPQPASNSKLADAIVANGGLLISEYGHDSIVSKYNYPQRDRIQSLLSSTTIVIQATDNSGTMIAVKKSLADNKKVFALKGNNILLINDYIDVEDVDYIL